MNDTEEMRRRFSELRNGGSAQLMKELNELRKPEGERNVWSKFGVIIMAAVIGTFTFALVTQAWWAWFLTPHGLGSITLAQAIVMRFAGLLLVCRNGAKQPDRTLGEITSACFSWAIVAPGVFYLVGWAFVTWMPL